MKTGRVVIKRLPTGVDGLDQILGSGLPEFSFNVLAGSPGSGKTTLAHQIMFAIATVERPALYFTVLGEPPLKMLRYQQQFDFFDDEKINSAVFFINLAEEAGTGDFGKVIDRMAAEMKAKGPGLVIVDSFRSVVLSAQGNGQSRSDLKQFMQKLGNLMTSGQVMTFLIGEYADAEANPVFTIADGIIWLRQSTQRNSAVRKLEILKMRGQATLPGLHTFRIGPAGIRVFAPTAPASLALRPETAAIGARLTMGIPGLDEMMGGGLPAGYSILISGPSGSGKSIMAAAFLAEGARCGETGVIAAFEDRPNRSRGRTVVDLIEGGRIGVVDARASDLSVDEVGMLLVAEIRRLKATRVVIDSLSGFERSLAPTFRDDFRESMARLVAALAATGAAVMMTSELEDRYDDLRFSPYGTAFLTDAIIVQRYIEVDSRLQRMLAVVKVRASNHSNELRLFSIDDGGIRIGAMLTDREGLLGGRPTRRQPVRKPLVPEDG